jgi:arylsulfatase A-like enzyme
VDQFETKNRRTRSVEMFENLIASYEDPHEGLKRFTQAYLACVTAVDDNVGQVMRTINNTSLKDNTIVILTSDHGWTMGEKDHIYKNSLWEESTRVPLIIRVPEMTVPNTVVEHPVSLIDVYPTLLELTGIDLETRKNKKGHGLDGYSLVPFLKNPNTDNWQGPEGALSVVYSSDLNKNIPENHHYSIRTKDYRYIVYNTGQEELYDKKSDPKERNNLIFGESHPETSNMRALIKNITYPMVPQGIALIEDN